MPLHFEPIHLNRQADYSRRLSRCSQVASDFSFINLWGWADEYGLSWAWEQDLVWIRQQKPEELLWAPVGPWERIHWPEALDVAQAACRRIIRVPEKLYHHWQGIGVSLDQTQESREHWDYLYNIEELIQLKGNRFHKKKNLVNQFKKKYAYTYMPFCPEMASQALAMQTDWCTWRDCESHETLASENRVIAKVLNNHQAFPQITGGAIHVDHTLVAYTIAENLPDHSLLIHFEKGNPDYKGCYQAINQLFLENTQPRPALVNREQDLGNEGLRKAKLSYNPVDYVRKYEILL